MGRKPSNPLIQPPILSLTSEFSYEHISPRNYVGIHKLIPKFVSVDVCRNTVSVSNSIMDQFGAVISSGTYQEPPAIFLEYD
jgi:hypothetical protein